MPDGGEVEGVQGAVVELSQASEQIQAAEHLVEEVRQRFLEKRAEIEGEGRSESSTANGPLTPSTWTLL